LFFGALAGGMRKSEKARGMFRPLGGCTLGSGRDGTKGETWFAQIKWEKNMR
jgi:hypothetical protein